MRLLNRRKQRRIANAVLADPEEHTVMDERGGVRSVQAANVDIPESELVAIWAPMHLERLARTYWKYLSRVTFGLIRVVYGEHERAVVFLVRPFVLLRFNEPEYEVQADEGTVRWQIKDGVLVNKPGEGHLRIDVRRCPSEHPGYARAHVEVEVANFYPAISTWVARWFYKATQARIHVLVTHGFLRSLARLELEESAVGRFAEPAVGQGGNGARPETGARGQRPVNVGDTPWPAVGVLAGLAGGVAVALMVRRRRPSRRLPLAQP